MKKRGQIIFFTDLVALTYHFGCYLLNCANKWNKYGSNKNPHFIEFLLPLTHKTHDLSISKILALALFVTCQKDDLTWPAKQYPHHKNV